MFTEWDTYLCYRKENIIKLIGRFENNLFLSYAVVEGKRKEYFFFTFIK